MKSQANALLHVATALLLGDVRSAYPALKGLDLDVKRLALYCQTRGLGLFTLDLPSLDSLLLEALESGRLRLSGPLSRVVSKEVKVPRLFSGLWLRVFDKDACLKQDVDITALYFLRQLCCLGKKISVECSKDRIAAVMEEYHNVERELRSPTLDWVGDELYLGSVGDDHKLSDCCFTSSNFGLEIFEAQEKAGQEDISAEFETLRLLDQVQRVSDLIVESIDPYDPISLSEEWESAGMGAGFKHGPGAVSERLRKHEKSNFQCWPDKLQIVFPFSLVGKTIGDPRERPSRHEGPNRLLCVPKTAKGPRLIASEPVAHQYCQQHVSKFLVKQLSKCFGTYFIDFHDQSKSADMVLSASLDRSLATVDLSSASDRLSCWTVERVFRRNPSLLSALHATRTRYLRDDVSKNKGFLKLKKFAAQGTATTFPVQSIVFLCVALGASIRGRVTWDKVWELRDQVRVYGDDIIIPTHGYERLVRIMDALQLKVNVAKSYVNGYFRESCGVDGYKGYDVTPVKPKTLVADSPASCQAVVDTTNNLHLRGNWHASYSLETTLPPRIRRGLRIVAQHDAGFAGLASYSGSDESHLVKRWNSRLHRYEGRVWGFSLRTQPRDRQGFSALLDFFTSKHSHEHARTVSTYAGTRKTKSGLLWEPLNTGARLCHTETTGTRRSGLSASFEADLPPAVRQLRRWRT